MIIDNKCIGSLEPSRYDAKTVGVINIPGRVHHLLISMKKPIDIEEERREKKRKRNYVVSI